MVIPTYIFLAIAIVLAIVVGRAGTVFKDYLAEHRKETAK